MKFVNSPCTKQGPPKYQFPTTTQNTSTGKLRIKRAKQNCWSFGFATTNDCLSLSSISNWWAVQKLLLQDKIIRFWNEHRAFDEWNLDIEMVHRSENEVTKHLNTSIRALETGISPTQQLSTARADTKGKLWATLFIKQFWELMIWSFLFSKVQYFY